MRSHKKSDSWLVGSYFQPFKLSTFNHLSSAWPRLKCSRYKVIPIGTPVKTDSSTLSSIPECAVTDNRDNLNGGHLLPIVHEAEHSLELVTVSRLVSIAEKFWQRIPEKNADFVKTIIMTSSLSHRVVAVGWEGGHHALGQAGVFTWKIKS